MEERFHKIRKKAEEEAAGEGTAMPDDLHLIVIAASGMSRGRLYGVGSEAVALRGLLPCCADVGEK